MRVFIEFEKVHDGPNYGNGPWTWYEVPDGAKIERVPVWALDEYVNVPGKCELARYEMVFVTTPPKWGGGKFTVLKKHGDNRGYSSVVKRWEFEV